MTGKLGCRTRGVVKSAGRERRDGGERGGLHHTAITVVNKAVGMRPAGPGQRPYRTFPYITKFTIWGNRPEYFYLAVSVVVVGAVSFFAPIRTSVGWGAALGCHAREKETSFIIRHKLPRLLNGVIVGNEQ